MDFNFTINSNTKEEKTTCSSHHPTMERTPSPSHNATTILEPKRPAAKSMFLVAYSASSKSITHEMMQECGLCPMECHSLEYDGFKYSFVKLYRSAREGTIKAFMLHAVDLHGVVAEEMGVGTLSNHPAMLRIKAKLTNPAASTDVIESWKDGDAGVIKTSLNKRFKRSASDTNTSELDKAHARIKSLEAENNKLTASLQAYQKQHDMLKTCCLAADS